MKVREHGPSMEIQAGRLLSGGREDGRCHLPLELGREVPVFLKPDTILGHKPGPGGKTIPTLEFRETMRYVDQLEGALREV